jgi:hypothetical protein
LKKTKSARARESDYEFTGWKKGEHGWVDGYEEYLNPFDNKPSNEWLFNLMIPVHKKNQHSKREL